MQLCMSCPRILWHVKGHEDDQQEERHIARTERPRNLLTIAKLQHMEHMQMIPIAKVLVFYFQTQ